MTNMGTTGGWKCSHGRTTEMGVIVPRPDLPDDDGSGRWNLSFLWIIVAIVMMVAAGSAALLTMENRARKVADETAAIRGLDSAEQQETAPLVQFSPDNIQVNHRWTILAGKHPAVTFTGRIDPGLKDTKAVFLAYRTLGAKEWSTAEARARRDHTCRITLRDLHRNMPYECYFIVCTKDTMLQSNVLQFHT